MGQRWRSKGKAEPPEEAVLVISSSDDEEANADLSLAVMARAMEREANRRRAEGAATAPPAVIDLSSSSADDAGKAKERADDAGKAKERVTAGDTGVEEAAEGERREKKRGKRGKKKKRKSMAQENETMGVPDKQEEPLGMTAEEPLETADSGVTDVNKVPDNSVLRKLLRGPRYFDPGNSAWESCYNCGEEGHTAANCMAEKRQKPCFVCGLFGHKAKYCTQGQDCFICRKRGHQAKECPDKHKKIPLDAKTCLRCGGTGHDMSSCENDYPPDDLKEIQCYVCKEYGHLCCVDFADTYPGVVSCYNCAQTGHTGVGCAKSRGETSAAPALSTVCYKCGEEGHFARGCTQSSKSSRWLGESSTPAPKFNRGKRDSMAYRSAPHDHSKSHKQRSIIHEERWNMTGGRSKTKGGWIVDDPGDMPKKKFKSNGWTSPSTPVKKSYRNHLFDSGGCYSNSQYPKKHKSSAGTPNSHVSAGTYRQGFSASRFHNSHNSYGWT